MPVEEKHKLAREACLLETKMQKAQTVYKSSFPAMGKLICVVEEDLSELKSIKKIASNMSLASYWESITKSVKGSNGKPVKLNNHGLSCAVAFGTYVRSELITEADYDKNTAQCLELAAAISTAVGGEVTHDAVVEAAEELVDRSKDSATNLKRLLATVKDAPEMTVEQAQKALAKLFEHGHLPVVIAGIGAEIAHVEDAEIARSAFFAMITANDMFAENVDAKGKRRFPDKTLDAWTAAYQKANAKAPEAPATPETETETETPTEETPAAA
jgi:hypothetical protein